MFKTSVENFEIRFANENDVKIILDFINALAEYEGVLDKVTATEEILCDTLFNKKSAEVLIGEYESKPVAFALFHHGFSGFAGKLGLYIEDLFVSPDMRGKKLGKALFKQIGKIAKQRDCCRIALLCLDWNKPSIAFYKSMGAVCIDDSRIYRVTGEALHKLASE